VEQRAVLVLVVEEDLEGGLQSPSAATHLQRVAWCTMGGEVERGRGI